LACRPLDPGEGIAERNADHFVVVLLGSELFKEVIRWSVLARPERHDHLVLRFLGPLIDHLGAQGVKQSRACSPVAQNAKAFGGRPSFR